MAQLLEQAAIAVLDGEVDLAVAIAPGIEDRHLLGGAAFEQLHPVTAQWPESPGKVDEIACRDVAALAGGGLNVVEHPEDHRVEDFAFRHVEPFAVDAERPDAARGRRGIYLTQAVGQHAQRVAVGGMKPVAAMIEQRAEAVAVGVGASART